MYHLMDISQSLSYWLLNYWLLNYNNVFKTSKLILILFTERSKFDGMIVIPIINDNSSLTIEIIHVLCLYSWARFVWLIDWVLEFGIQRKKSYSLYASMWWNLYWALMGWSRWNSLTYWLNLECETRTSESGLFYVSCYSHLCLSHLVIFPRFVCTIICTVFYTFFLWGVAEDNKGFSGCKYQATSSITTIYFFKWINMLEYYHIILYII